MKVAYKPFYKAEKLKNLGKKITNVNDTTHKLIKKGEIASGIIHFRICVFPSRT
jgi:hypothetical protein